MAAKKDSNNTTANQKRTTTSPSKDSSTILLWGVAFILVFVTALVYKGVLDNDFVDWDDYEYVLQNDLVRSNADIQAATVLKGSGRMAKATPSPYQTSIKDVFTRAVGLNYHPLTMLSLRWNNNASPTSSEGISAYPFLLWNLILHLLNSILVLLLIYRLSKKNLWASTLVAVLFAWHPAHVESVAWVSERKDVLYSFFFLLGLLSYWSYLERGDKKWFWGAFGLFILACLSKAMAVVFPLVLVLLHFWKSPQEPLAALKESLAPKTWIPLLPFFAVALFFGILAVNIQAGGDFYGLITPSTTTGAIAKMETFSLWERFQFAGHGFMQYIFHFFWPLNLSPYYPYPTQEVLEASMWFKLAPFLMGAVLVGALVSLRTTKALAMGIGFYFFTVVLVLQFIAVGGVVMADRYTYLPYIGLGMALAFLLQQYLPKEKQSLVFGVLIGGSLLLAAKTNQQIEVWQDSESLWTTAIALQTKKGQDLEANMLIPLTNRGGYYAKKAQNSRNLAQNQQYLQKAYLDYNQAAQLGSKNSKVYQGLGDYHGMMGNTQLDQARQFQQKGRRAEATQMQQQAYQHFRKAINYYGEILEVAPEESLNAYFNRAVTYSIMRDHARAIADYTAFIKHSPQPVGDAHLNRGISYYELKNYPAARADFQKALQLNPQDQLAKRYLNKTPTQ